MSGKLSVRELSDSDLSECDCRKGLDVRTPVLICNRPGLDKLNYRIGTHAMFKQSMLARISGNRDCGLQTTLSQLKTKENNDFSIALLDAWAVIADVLTFYQERIANESYLLTARERFSLLHMARLIGYELRPGVAASTYLAFTMGETKSFANLAVPGLPESITLNTGIKVQSVPGSGESAQLFETIEKIECRGKWNNINPRLTKKQQLTSSTNTIFLDGISTNLKLGDGVLFRADFDTGEGTYVFGLVAKVEPNTKQNHTKVMLQLEKKESEKIGLQGIRAKPNTLSPLVKRYLAKTISSSKLEAEGAEERFKVQEIFYNLVASPELSSKVLVFRTRAMVFGHNAPSWKALPLALREYEPVYGIEKDGTVNLAPASPGPYKKRENSWAETHLLEYHNHLVKAGKIATLESNERYKLNEIDEFKRYELSEKDVNLGSVKSSGVKQRLINLNLTKIDLKLPMTLRYLYLDNLYTNIVRESCVVLKNEDTWSIYKIEDLTELSISDFTFSTKVTRLTLNDSSNYFPKFSIRTTTVFAQSEELSLSRVPEEKFFPAEESSQTDKNGLLKLEGWINGLYADQHIIVSGEIYESSGIRASEHAIIDEVEHILSQEGCTQISLKQKLKNKYVRSTVSINGNVALATHGETRQEVLGSGNAQPYQRFTLKQPPLTYLTAETPSGAESTLEVRVNDVLWHEVPTLYGQGPEERIYVTQLDNEGKTTVQFGDGKTGSLLPTGQENIRAAYRRGIGLEGLVKANQLNLLMTRPLGVSSVTNPFDSDGADDSEKESEARRNAPLTVLTLDRIVSLKDYEDFARSFTGISKALATWTWEGHARKVFITIAGPDGAELKSESPIIEKLKSAIFKAGDPQIPIKVESYQKVYFSLAAHINVLDDYIPDKVLKSVTEALRETFSFSKREFGQAVLLSEVTATIQNVAGVGSVNVSRIYRSKLRPDEPPATLPLAYLEASMPLTGTKATAAELLILDPCPLTELEVN